MTPAIEKLVFQAYQAVLRRNPDAEGLNFWSTKAFEAASGGQDPSAYLLAALQNSDEGKCVVATGSQCSQFWRGKPISTFPWLWVGLGAGALVLLGTGAFFLWPKKTPAQAVAGYRRRKRR